MCLNVKKMVAMFTCLASYSAVSITDLNSKIYKNYTKNISADVSGKYKISSGNNNKNELEVELSSVYTVFDKNNPTLIERSFFFIGDYKKEINNSVLTDEKTMFHLRFQEKYKENFYGSVFGQISHNPFKRLKRRTLLGLGGSVKTYENKDIKIFFNMMVMSEKEELAKTKDSNNSSLMNKFYRLSLATYYTISLDDNFKFNHSLYVQPNISNFKSDYRAYSKLALEYIINSWHSIENSYKVEYDNLPPAGVKKTDQKIETKYVLTF